MESADQAIANVSVKVYLSSEEVEGGVVDAFIYRCMCSHECMHA